MPNSTREFHFQGFRADTRREARDYAATVAQRNRVLRFYLQEHGTVKYVERSVILQMLEYRWNGYTKTVKICDISTEDELVEMDTVEQMAGRADDEDMDTDEVVVVDEEMDDDDGIVVIG